LKHGNEMVSTNQVDSRLSCSCRQREKREGIVLKIVPLPAPPVPLDQFCQLMERRVTLWMDDPNNIRSLRIITRPASL
jgi:hypothetical protein